MTFETYQDLRDLSGPPRPMKISATYQDLRDLSRLLRPFKTFETYHDLRDLSPLPRPIRTSATYQDLRDLSRLPRPIKTSETYQDLRDLSRPEQSGPPPAYQKFRIFQTRESSLMRKLMFVSQLFSDFTLTRSNGLLVHPPARNL